MRLVLMGGTSFIAHHVHKAAMARDIETIVCNRGQNLPNLVASDIVMNFTISPAYQRQPYDETADCDLAIARLAAKSGAKVLLLSTRRVYPTHKRWDAQASGFLEGDETPYGQNKARSEKAVLALSSRNAIFRLANVFGFEYRPTGSRQTFFGQMLRSLKEKDVIHFDMHPDTKRDFIPVETCAEVLIQAVRDDLCGIYNLGSGFPTRCGDLANSLCEGYGSGTLTVDNQLVRDEFFLNMSDWTSRYGSITTRDQVLNYCNELGQRLKCGKF